MPIGLFINNFFRTQSDKDPGLIAQSLTALGHEVTVYCYETETMDHFDAVYSGLKIKTITPLEGRSASFWQTEKLEAVLVYSWLSLRFTPLLKALKSAGDKIILKLDSDGRLLYPLRPSYLRVKGLTSSNRDKLIYLARLIQWYIFPKLISRRRLKQLTLADAVIIESPLARENLLGSLNFWKRSDLKEKIRFLPNPLSPKIETSRLDSEKTNLIISIARWADKRKNATGLVKTLLAINLPADWEILLIGSGATGLLTTIKKGKPALKITAQEQVAHKDIFSYLAGAKIFFAPSITDSFNLAATEALGCGCSLAATPLESFRFFAGENQYGTIAADFQTVSLDAALSREIAKWNQGKYQPAATARYWRRELSAAKIGGALSDLFKSL